METNVRKIIHAAIVASTIVIQENARAARDAARKSDCGASANGSRRIFSVRFFKRSRSPWNAIAYASH